MFNFRERGEGGEETAAPNGLSAFAAINNCPQSKHLSRCSHFQGDRLCPHSRLIFKRLRGGDGREGQKVHRQEPATPRSTSPEMQGKVSAGSAGNRGGHVHPVGTLTMSPQMHSLQSGSVQGEHRGDENKWTEHGEEEIIKYLPPRSTPSTQAARNPISNKGGDLSTQGPAPLSRAAES